MTDSPRFDIGDRVVDLRADEPEPMYVLDPDRGRANEIYIDALEATVAEVNPEYPADDRVVACVHRSWLEHNVGDRWETWRDDRFAARLREFADEWSLSIRSYDYPESRLAFAEEEPAGPADAAPTSRPNQEGQTNMDDWLGE